MIKALKSGFKKNKFLYSIYLFVFRNNVHREKKMELLFYKNLNIKRLVFDIGANIGNKTALFNKFGVAVISLEPDEDNFKLLQDRFRNSKNITLLPIAASNKNGETTFLIDHPGSAFNTLSVKWKDVLKDPAANRWSSEKQFSSERKVETITLDKLIEQYGIPDYIKIDIEGHELECLHGLTKRIRLISFEANLPEFKKETIQCIQHLYEIDSNAEFNCSINEIDFHFKENLKADDFSKYINDTDLRYMEIFSFMN